LLSLLPLKLDADQECAERGAIGTRVAAAGRVLGCEHVGGPVMDGGRYLHLKAWPRSREGCSRRLAKWIW
jgi:hypothetical protein